MKIAWVAFGANALAAATNLAAACVATTRMAIACYSIAALLFAWSAVLWHFSATKDS